MRSVKAVTTSIEYPVDDLSKTAQACSRGLVMQIGVSVQRGNRRSLSA